MLKYLNTSSGDGNAVARPSGRRAAAWMVAVCLTSDPGTAAALAMCRSPVERIPICPSAQSILIQAILPAAAVPTYHPDNFEPAHHAHVTKFIDRPLLTELSGRLTPASREKLTDLERARLDAVVVDGVTTHPELAVRFTMSVQRSKSFLMELKNKLRMLLRRQEQDSGATAGVALESPASGPNILKLSEIQRRIMDLIGAGLENKEILTALSREGRWISANTLRRHIAAIRLELDLADGQRQPRPLLVWVIHKRGYFRPAIPPALLQAISECARNLPAPLKEIFGFGIQGMTIGQMAEIKGFRNKDRIEHNIRSIELRLRERTSGPTFEQFNVTFAVAVALVASYPFVPTKHRSAKPGNVFRIRRKMKKIPLQEAADFAGISISLLSKIESGDRRPKRNVAVKLGQLLEIGDADLDLPSEIRPHSGLPEDIEDWRSALGDRLSLILKRLGRDRTQVAKAIGYPPEKLLRVAQGKQELRFPIYRSLARELRMPLELLMDPSEALPVRLPRFSPPLSTGKQIADWFRSQVNEDQMSGMARQINMRLETLRRSLRNLERNGNLLPSQIRRLASGLHATVGDAVSLRRRLPAA